MQNFDVVMPHGNEAELIEAAIALGYDRIVFLSDNINYRCPSSDNRIRVLRGFLLKDVNMLYKARRSFDYLFAPAERKFFEQHVDYIINAELSDRRDSFHYRNTSLNQVHAKLAKENHSSIIFNFGLLLGSRGKMRQIAFGRMMQNATIARKYKLRYSAFSMARTPSEMRSRVMLDALENVLGIGCY